MADDATAAGPGSADDATAGRPGSADDATGYRPSLSHLADAEFRSRGWRSFFAYRDLGVKAATDGDYDVRVVRAQAGEHTSTGWHHHLLAVQIVYCVGGWEVIGLEDGRMAKLVPGSCLQIPSGFDHNEVGYGPDMEMLVISGPDAVTTVPVDPPAGWDEMAVARRVEVEMSPGRRLLPWSWRERGPGPVTVAAPTPADEDAR